MAEKEYIERNALIAEYDRVHIGPPGGARKLMEEAPTADVAEVKHGKWEQNKQWEYDYNCSICGEYACESGYGNIVSNYSFRDDQRKF